MKGNIIIPESVEAILKKIVLGMNLSDEEVFFLEASYGDIQDKDRDEAIEKGNFNFQQMRMKTHEHIMKKSIGWRESK